MEDLLFLTSLVHYLKLTYFHLSCRIHTDMHLIVVPARKIKKKNYIYKI